MQFEMRFTKEAQRCENVLYFASSAAVSTTLMSQIAQALSTWWIGNIRQVMSTTLALQEIYCTDITSQTGPTVSFTTGLPAGGTVAGEALPNNVAMCLSFRTAQRGRSARGRNYLFGFPETATSGSFFDNNLVNSMVTAYSLLLGAGTFVPGSNWVVVSRFQFNNPRPTGITIPITSVVSTNNAVDSQRRRLPGRGK
jgi:hypothetical protein